MRTIEQLLTERGIKRISLTASELTPKRFSKGFFYRLARLVARKDFKKAYVNIPNSKRDLLFFSKQFEAKLKQETNSHEHYSKCLAKVRYFLSPSLNRKQLKRENLYEIFTMDVVSKEGYISFSIDR